VVMGWPTTSGDFSAASMISAATRGRRRDLSRRGRGLRAAFATLALILAVPAGAVAADMPEFLRGSYAPSYTRWDGVNFGVQAGLSNMNTDFSSAGQSLVANILRNSSLEAQAVPSSWNVLSSDASNGRSYGVFLGYNYQWDQLVVGVDLAYNHTGSLQTSDGPTVIERIVGIGNIAHDVAIMTQSSINLIDYATARLRAGYAFGQFLPYGMVGVAVGRFNYATSVTLADLQTDPNNNKSLFGPISESVAKNNAFVGGFTTGLGFDVAVLPNVFLRAEWEYLVFGQVEGIRTAINTGRVGVGVKF
jgi:outer membrane immunogenic protein